MADDLLNLPENWEGGSIYYNDIFLAIVGKSCNGKSSTANTILGKSAFVVSNSTMLWTTRSSKMKNTILKDGRHVHVIDTPGIFDLSTTSDFLDKEILKGIDLTKDGLHAVIIVFCIHKRFTREEEIVIKYVKSFFGDRISNYLIVVLTGGDVLEKRKQTFSEWFKVDCPNQLKNFILFCDSRVVVFDNITEDEVKRERQIKRLISFIDFVVAINGGKLFTRQMIAQAKEGALGQQQRKKESKDIPECSTKRLSKRKEEHDKSCDDEFEDISEMVHHDLYEKIEKLEKSLREEKTSRLKLEKVSLEAKEIAQAAEAARLISDGKIRELRAEVDSYCGCVIL